MAPPTRILAAHILIPVALVIALLAANIGSWVVVAAMTLLVFCQVINLRAGREQLGRRNLN